MPGQVGKTKAGRQNEEEGSLNGRREQNTRKAERTKDKGSDMAEKEITAVQMSARKGG